ncbi:MAG: hypothetical protein R3F21_14145 [Myxococcota bacterium]
MEVLEEDKAVDALECHALEKFSEIFASGGWTLLDRRAARIEKGSSIGIEGHPPSSSSTAYGATIRSSRSIKRFRRPSRCLPRSPWRRRADLDLLTLGAEEIERLRVLDGTTRTRSSNAHRR